MGHLVGGIWQGWLTHSLQLFPCQLSGDLEMRMGGGGGDWVIEMLITPVPTQPIIILLISK